MPKFGKFLTIFIIAALVIAVIFVSAIVRFVFDAAFTLINGATNIVELAVDGGTKLGDIFGFEDGQLIWGGYPVELGDFDLSALNKLAASSDVSEGGFAAKRYTFDASQNRALDIDISGCDVMITSGDTDEITVEVLESTDFAYKFATVDGTLTIGDSASERANTITLFGFEIPLGKTRTRYTGLSMLIGVPADFSGEIELETSSGDVVIGGLALADTLDVTTADGDIEIASVSADEIEATTAAGRITLADLSATEIDALTSGGRISMSNLTAKRLAATTSAASIDFVRLFGEKFEFSTNGGDIDGTIIGSESLFTIDTVSDRSASPASRANPRAQYSLRAKTSGGDISIRFVE